MNWKKAIGFGVLIWVLMFAIVSAFIAFKLYDFTWMKVITAIIAGLIAFVLAGKVKPSKTSLALTYGVTWVAIGVILDAVITKQFEPAIFSQWSLWLGYLLVVLAPVLKVKRK